MSYFSFSIRDSVPSPVSVGGIAASDDEEVDGSNHALLESRYKAVQFEALNFSD